MEVESHLTKKCFSNQVKEEKLCSCKPGENILFVFTDDNIPVGTL